MFSRTAEYALRAAAFLASHPGTPVTAQALSAGTLVPRSYASKVLRDLTRGRIVEGQRGPNGGFWLARDPSQISVLEVVNAVDPLKRITSCPLGLPSHSGKLCKLHQTMDDAIRLVEQALGSTSIADLVSSLPASASAKCVFPPLTVSGKSPKLPA